MIAPDNAQFIINLCRKKNIRLATVESCTGGLIIASLTNIAGSSDVIECGFITYSNESKSNLVGVPALLISSFGAVSKPVAIAMAEGALVKANVDIVISVTGIAGPSGGTKDKPVGLVHFAVASKGRKTKHYECHFKNEGRQNIRQQAVLKAFDCITENIENI